MNSPKSCVGAFLNLNFWSLVGIFSKICFLFPVTGLAEFKVLRSSARRMRTRAVEVRPRSPSWTSSRPTSPSTRSTNLKTECWGQTIMTLVHLKAAARVFRQPLQPQWQPRGCTKRTQPLQGQVLVGFRADFHRKTTTSPRLDLVMGGIRWVGCGSLVTGPRAPGTLKMGTERRGRDSSEQRVTVHKDTHRTSKLHYLVLFIKLM